MKLSESEQIKANDPDNYELNPNTGRYNKKKIKKIKNEIKKDDTSIKSTSIKSTKSLIKYKETKYKETKHDMYKICKFLRIKKYYSMNKDEIFLMIKKQCSILKIQRWMRNQIFSKKEDRCPISLEPIKYPCFGYKTENNLFIYYSLKSLRNYLITSENFEDPSTKGKYTLKQLTDIDNMYRYYYDYSYYCLHPNLHTEDNYYRRVFRIFEEKERRSILEQQQYIREQQFIREQQMIREQQINRVKQNINLQLKQKLDHLISCISIKYEEDMRKEINKYYVFIFNIVYKLANFISVQEAKIYIRTKLIEQIDYVSKFKNIFIDNYFHVYTLLLSELEYADFDFDEIFSNQYFNDYL